MPPDRTARRNASPSDAIAALITSHAQLPGPLLPLLHAIQDQIGHVPADAVPAIAAGLNLSRAEVHGVITYYHHFRTAPAGRHVVQVCRAEACQACGAGDVLSQAEALLGCAVDQTRPDGAASLESAYCLGLCASSPAICIDERLHARVTPPRLAQLLGALGLPR
jgi:formate dehydrogenase subunit gamma